MSPLNAKPALPLYLAAALALLGSCQRAPDPVQAVQPLTAGEAAKLAALRHRAPDEIVLDLDAHGGALVATVLPAPPESDADRTLRVRLLDEGGARGFKFANEPVLDARFVPGSSALVVLTASHALVRLDAPEAEPVRLDDEVQGPLSVDARGRYVAYTRGEEIAVTVARHPITGGSREELAPALAPAWCPSLSDDGSEVIAVASVDGRPRIWQERGREGPTVWERPDDAAFPTGPTAPLRVRDVVVFEDEAGVHAVGVDRRARASFKGWHLPVRLPDGAGVLVQRRGELRWIAYSALGAAP